MSGQTPTHLVRVACRESVAWRANENMRAVAAPVWIPCLLPAVFLSSLSD